jgi:hypothetical protein
MSLVLTTQISMVITLTNGLMNSQKTMMFMSEKLVVLVISVE